MYLELFWQNQYYLAYVYDTAYWPYLLFKSVLSGHVDSMYYSRNVKVQQYIIFPQTLTATKPIITITDKQCFSQ